MDKDDDLDLHIGVTLVIGHEVADQVAAPGPF